MNQERKIKELEKELYKTKQMCAKKQSERMQLHEKISKIEALFTKNQLKSLYSSKKCGKWTAKDISPAMVLYSAGPRAYRMLRLQGLPLPAPITLKKWAAKINIQPGIIEPVLPLLPKDEQTNSQYCDECQRKGEIFQIG